MPANKISTRIDALTRIPQEYRHAVIPAPPSVKVELTGRCNFSCSFCARSQNLREQKDMDRKFYSRLIRELRAAGVEELGLFYLGESFLLPWLPEAIAEAKKVGFPYVFLTTNGSAAGPEKVHACMAAGLDSLKWSLNYADSRQFHEITHAKPGLWQTILDNVQQAHQVRTAGGFSCGLYASYILYDDEQAVRMGSVVSQVRPWVDEIYALPLYNQGGLLTASEQAMGWKPSAGNRGRAFAMVPALPCWAVFREGHVTWDGFLSACCFDHKEGWIMGDLSKLSFLQAWNSPAFQKLRKAHLDGEVSETPCQACAVLQT